MSNTYNLSGVMLKKHYHCRKKKMQLQVHHSLQGYHHT